MITKYTIIKNEFSGFTHRTVFKRYSLTKYSGFLYLCIKFSILFMGWKVFDNKTLLNPMVPLGIMVVCAVILLFNLI